METVTSRDGTDVAYERTGTGPPLVLVHGICADHGSWADVRPALEAAVTVYAVDRRGRGESGDAAEYALEREFEDVAAVVDSLDGPATLFGHSFGALCCLGAAARTNSLRRLVLYEPTVPVGDSLEGRYPVEVLDDVEALLQDGRNERALSRFLSGVAQLPAARIDALRSAAGWPARVDAAHTVLREARAVTAGGFDADALAAVTTPTVLLSGSESPRWARDVTAAIDEMLPNGRLVTLDGVGRLAHYTAPDRFAETVLASVSDAA
jgi:pimeloyl-ACP methyl ester carboxylesterase